MSKCPSLLMLFQEKGLKMGPACTSTNEWNRVLDMITRWKKHPCSCPVCFVTSQNKTTMHCKERTPSGYPMVKLKNLICPAVEEYEPPVWHWLPVGNTRELVKCYECCQWSRCWHQMAAVFLQAQNYLSASFLLLTFLTLWQHCSHPDQSCYLWPGKFNLSLPCLSFGRIMCSSFGFR